MRLRGTLTLLVVAMAGCGGAGTGEAVSDAGPGDDHRENGADVAFPTPDALSGDGNDSSDGAPSREVDGVVSTTDALWDVVLPADGPSAGCPVDLPGPPFVRVPTPSGSGTGGYTCIDATEVTNAQYAQFLSANYPISAQDPWCAWNTSFTPPRGWPATGTDNEPVVYVWWCDAFSYCKWAGKRLCGKIGGGANAYGAYADATASEWFNACSASGSRVYPYGNTFSAAACNGQAGGDSGIGGVVPVGRQPGCEGGELGVFDLSGNVTEWEDSCTGTTGVNDSCRLRGGSFISDANGLRCDSSDNVTRDSATDHIGFRCCSATP